MRLRKLLSHTGNVGHGRLANRFDLLPNSLNIARSDPVEGHCLVIFVRFHSAQAADRDL